MKCITAYIHRIKSPTTVRALIDAGFQQVVMDEVAGTLPALTESEQTFSPAGSEFRVSEIRLTLYCEDALLEKALGIIRATAQLGNKVSGWVYVSTLDVAMQLGGDTP